MEYIGLACGLCYLSTYFSTTYRSDRSEPETSIFQTSRAHELQRSELGSSTPALLPFDVSGGVFRVALAAGGCAVS